MYTGPKLTNKDLVFGYDTGYGVADNTTDTRFYPGEPTTNATPSVDFLNMSNWTSSGWSGSLSVSTDYDNTIEMTSTNGWRTHNIDTGITSGGTVTVSYEYKIKSIQTSSIYMLNLNGTNLGTYTNGLGNTSNADTTSGVWKTFTSSWTANSDSKLALGLRGTDGQGLTDTIYVRNLQVELNSHATPYTSSSRSDTASLIDLKRTTNIDVSNVSFDSTGQPEFDGTNDVITTSFPATTIPTVTIEAVVYRNQATGRYEAIVQNNNATDDALYVNPSGVLMFWPCGGSSLTVPTGQWSHVAVSYNGTTLTYMVNGTIQVVTATCSHITDWDFLRIGGHGTTDGERWIGKIAVAKVYEKSLSAAELTSNYNAYKNRFNI